MNVGDRIKEARKVRGLTQKQLAEKIGVAEITIRQYENNKRSLSLEQLEKIAKVLDTAITFLIDGRTVHDPLDHFWFIDLEEKLKQIGYSTNYDQENAMVWICYPDGTLEVSDDDLKELHASINEYMRFKLEELKKKKLQDFRPKRGTSK